MDINYSRVMPEANIVRFTEHTYQKAYKIYKLQPSIKLY